MTTVTEAFFSVEAKEAANDELVALIDAGSGAGSIKIRDTDDVLLAEIPLDDPCGTVSAVTGQLTFTIDGTDESPTAGDAHYAQFCDSDDNVHLTLPVQEGSVAVSGYLVINATAILDGTIVSVIGATVG